MNTRYGILYTLNKVLSISAWPMFRFVADDENDPTAGELTPPGPIVSCPFAPPGPPLSFDSLLGFFDDEEDCASKIVLLTSCVGLSAPHIVKLKRASFHCSMQYGRADSRRLPIIWRDINSPASC